MEEVLFHIKYFINLTNQSFLRIMQKLSIPM